MRLFVFVNRVTEIGFRQTTALLIAALYRQGHEIFLSDVDGLSLQRSEEYEPDARASEFPATSSKNKPSIFACAIQFQLNTPQIDNYSVAKFVQQVESTDFQQLSVQKDDLILIRTNPGRDLEQSDKHDRFLELCKIAKAYGIRVINEPNQLALLASKTAVALLPKKYRPEMIVTQNIDTAVAFIRDAACDCVVKPELGSRGNNVIRIRSDELDPPKVLQENFGSQNLVVQHFIDAEEQGDKRVVVLNGRLLEYGNHYAGIHRIPASGEFRANLHAGGIAQPLTLSTQQRDAALASATLLFTNGIQLAGIDLVGSKVIEFNVFSTGGLFDANRFANFDFSEQVAIKLLHD